MLSVHIPLIVLDQSVITSADSCSIGTVVLLQTSNTVLSSTLFKYGAWCLQVIDSNQKVLRSRQCSLRDASIRVAYVRHGVLVAVCLQVSLRRSSLTIEATESRISRYSTWTWRPDYLRYANNIDFTGINKIADRHMVWSSELQRDRDKTMRKA